MIMAKGSGVPEQSLVSIPAGAVRHIERISGSEEQARRLTELGLVAGAEISILSRSRHGMMVRIGGCRLALASGMADGIWVK